MCDKFPLVFAEKQNEVLLDLFFKIAVLKNLVIFTGIHLC